MKRGNEKADTGGREKMAFVSWNLTALSAQLGYIVPIVV